MSKLFPATACRITPKGIANPFGTLKLAPCPFARASSFPEDAALAPAICGESARSTTGITPCADRLNEPTLGGVEFFFGFDSAPGAAFDDSFSTVPASSLAASTRTPPAGSTVSRIMPSPALVASVSNSGASAVHVKTTPSCRARSAKWLSTGRSRDRTTPRHLGGNSSSPLASAQKTMAPSGGSSRDQASLKALQRRARPFAQPAAIVVHGGSPAAAFALCIASWTNFETWKSTEARSSASTKTATAWPSTRSAFPSAGTLE
mmetsp:Transcript_72015/g.203393  ORF Transcript_72015/g.203393 Transcript_72015/m.203393 type:complete len:263 (+) Transcript_72015:379-1167(+)